MCSTRHVTSDSSHSIEPWDKKKLYAMGYQFHYRWGSSGLNSARKTGTWAAAGYSAWHGYSASVYKHRNKKRISANTSAKVKQASSGSQQPGRISLIWVHEGVLLCSVPCIYFSKRQRPSVIFRNRGSSFLCAVTFLTCDERWESSTSGCGALWHLISSFQTDGCVLVEIRSGLVAIVQIFWGGEENKVSLCYCLPKKRWGNTMKLVTDYLENRNNSYFRIKAQAHQEPADWSFPLQLTCLLRNSLTATAVVTHAWWSNLTSLSRGARDAVRAGLTIISFGAWGS